MAFAELRSNLERLVVRYGPDNFVVDQTWLETPARLQKLAPVCWAEVSRALSVESKVTRCGLRGWAHWAAASVEEAESAIEESGLVTETSAWNELFGVPQVRHFISVSKGRTNGTKRRVELSTIQGTVEGRLHPEDEKFSSPFGIQLDVDVFLENPEKLTKDGLRGFLDDGISEMRNLFEQTQKVLHANPSDE
jgi:hypothetical protein